MTTQTGTMQALLFTAIRKLELVEVPIPDLRDAQEVLLKVKSVGVCGSDLHGYTGQSGRRTPPLIMGHEVTAEVVAVGEGVRDLPIGARVAVQPVEFCGRCPQCLAGFRSLCEKRRLMGMNAPGAYAEYVVWYAPNLYRLPDSLSDEHGALAEPLAIAVHAVGLTNHLTYETAFVIGAGPIGLLTLAVLKERGVNRVLVSDTSDARLAIARQIGADVTVNPTQQDVQAVVKDYTDGRGVEVAFEAVGLSATAQQAVNVTCNKGTVVWIGNNQRMIEVDMQAIVTRELSVLGSYGMTDDEFQDALALLAAGKIPAQQLINRRATLSEGPQLFDQLLAEPQTIKCMIALG